MEDMEHNVMNKDRVSGAAKVIKGRAEQVAGKVVGDSKLQAKGAADKTAGMFQNTVGGVRKASGSAKKAR